MLYQAIYVEAGSPAVPREILRQPDIAKYVAAWGRNGDMGLVAVEAETGQPIGAIWLRLFNANNAGYGYVADDIPELGIAVLPEYRGQGVGTQLLDDLLTLARSRYAAVSLSVDPHNRAKGLYERFGFKSVGMNGTSVVMLWSVGQ